VQRLVHVAGEMEEPAQRHSAISVVRARANCRDVLGIGDDKVLRRRLTHMDR